MIALNVNLVGIFREKNMVKNDRKNFEIPAHLSSEKGNTERENSKLYIILNFPLFFLLTEEIQSGKIQNFIYHFKFSRSAFPCAENKRAEISKFCLSFFTLLLYIGANRYFF